ncbi:hypothetical protein ACFVXG_22305 [Kitasatospora sp. NPDC058162]|uniref:hypothetical protein n=1 Tax=Kitasatospora sp. NPDC058162 TaxID=3346362 RepID=UPI0036DB22C8
MPARRSSSRSGGGSFGVERGQAQAGVLGVGVRAGVLGEVVVDVFELFAQAGGVGEEAVGDVEGVPHEAGDRVVRGGAGFEEFEDEGGGFVAEKARSGRSGHGAGSRDGRQTTPVGADWMPHLPTAA